MQIPFGKYEGWEIEDIPNSYLEWMVDNIEDKDEMMDEVKLELKSRKEYGGYID